MYETTVFNLAGLSFFPPAEKLRRYVLLLLSLISY